MSAPPERGWLSLRALLPALLAFGVAFTAWLAAQPPGEIFFSGDGALKALYAKELLRRGPVLDLDLPADPWVRSLWDSGLFPFKPPFVYAEGGRQLFGLPVLFPALCAPFYGLFGYGGLYVLPLFSLWLLWWRFLRACRGLGLSTGAAALGLAILVASPLTPYGAVFWEHVPAALLAFVAIEEVALAGAAIRPGHQAFVRGAVAGAAAWLRPELACLLAPAALLVFVAAPRPRARNALPFGAGIAASALLLLIANVALYGGPLGLHARQVLGADGSDRVEVAMEAFAWMGRLLLLDYPAVLVLPIAVGLAATATARTQLLTAAALRLLALGAMFVVLVPAMLPNAGGKQLGPRYLVAMAPAVALALAAAWEALARASRRALASAVLALALAALGVGAWRTVVIRGGQLVRDYRGRVWPAIDALRGHPARQVLVTNQWTAQELVSLFESKIFFHAPTTDESVRLADALAHHGAPRFLAVLRLQDSLPDWLPAPSDATIAGVRFRPLGMRGSFRILEGESLPR